MATDTETKKEDKFPGKILSPAQGPQKEEKRKASTHVNALGQVPRAQMQQSDIDQAILEESQESKTINTEDETMGELVGKHALAVNNGDEYVETSTKNYRALQPKGNNNGPYFCWKGVKLTTFGQIDKIEAMESQTAHDRMHPDVKTVVISG